MRLTISLLFLFLTCFLQAQGSYKYTVKGMVVDNDKQKGIPGAVVSLFGSDGSRNVVFADSTGSYFLDSSNFFSGVTYVVTASAANLDTGYVREVFLGNPKAKFVTFGFDHDSDFVFHFELVKVFRCGFRYPAAIFEWNKSELTQRVKDSLDIYYKMLKDNPNLVVDITAYALSKEKSPDKLTFERSKIINQYLIGKGIKPDRLVSKVSVRDKNSEDEIKIYGSKQPLVNISIIRKDYKGQ
jgi:hypothetical protein